VAGIAEFAAPFDLSARRSRQADTGVSTFTDFAGLCCKCVQRGQRPIDCSLRGFVSESGGANEQQGRCYWHRPSEFLFERPLKDTLRAHFRLVRRLTEIPDLRAMVLAVNAVVDFLLESDS